jgi:very-short-patch-repair endonuclease
MTDGERKLWSLLRRRQLSKFRFRRQATMGPYIGDFFCPEAKLIVELDGEPHFADKQIRRDEVRTRWLENHGCRVVRILNRDVFQKPHAVLDAIHQLLVQHPPSGPPAYALASAGHGARPPKLRSSEGGSGHLPPQGGKNDPR